MKEPGVIILGAGPAGIGAALSLGEDAVVLEAQPNVAGLCETLTIGGAVFDLGGHSFHTPHPEIRRLVFEAVAMEEQFREAWVWIHKEWIRYPFQKHYRDLQNVAIRASCDDGLTSAGKGNAPQNFEDYLPHRFGSGIAEHFMTPYNRKIWGKNLARMKNDWAGERVAGLPGEAERFEPSGGRRKPLQSDTVVGYPSRGGFGGIFRALAKRIHDLRLAEAALSISPASHSLTTSRGKLSWRRIVSTLPLPRLLELLPHVPDSIRAAASRLETRPVTLVMIALDERIKTEKQRVYVPGSEMPGHKIVLNHNSSRWLHSLPHHGIQVEVSDTPEYVRPHPLLIKDVVRGLTRMGLISCSTHIVAAEVMSFPYGYPVPTHTRDDIVTEIRQWLAERAIYTVGRFGEWAYINSDEALHRGICLGRHLMAEI